MCKNKHIKKVFETEWFSIDAIPSQGEKPYYRLSCNDSVSIIAKTEDEKIILIRQYRPAIQDFTLELPSGYVDAEESPEEAIKRELKEETGFICDSVICMGSLKIAPSRINNNLHVFFGKGATFTGTEETDKEIELVTEEEFKKLIVESKYTETAGIAMFLLAQLRGLLMNHLEKHLFYRNTPQLCCGWEPNTGRNATSDALSGRYPTALLWGASLHHIGLLS